MLAPSSPGHIARTRAAAADMSEYAAQRRSPLASSRRANTRQARVSPPMATAKPTPCSIALALSSSGVPSGAPGGNEVGRLDPAQIAEGEQAERVLTEVVAVARERLNHDDGDKQRAGKRATGEQATCFLTHGDLHFVRMSHQPENAARCDRSRRRSTEGRTEVFGPSCSDRHVRNASDRRRLVRIPQDVRSGCADTRCVDRITPGRRTETARGSELLHRTNRLPLRRRPVCWRAPLRPRTPRSKFLVAVPKPARARRRASSTSVAPHAPPRHGWLPRRAF